MTGKFYKKKLNNGITLIYEERDLPIALLSITNNFGSGHESNEYKGLAHFIEHLLFTGTDKRTSKQITKEIEQYGGNMNAFTANEITSFYVKLPSEHLSVGLEVLTDMINNSIIPEDKFEKEKNVVLEEIKMNHDDPMDSVIEQVEKNLYEKYFGEPILGTPETINSMNVEDIRNIYKEVYDPKNFIVTVVGKADIQKVEKYLEDNFISKGRERKNPVIKKKNGSTVEERKNIDQAHFVFGTHAPLRKDKGYYALKLLNTYLADGMSSRLFQEIREKRGLAYAIKGIIRAEKSYSEYLIYVGTKKSSLKKVEDIILKELDKVKEMDEKTLEGLKEENIGVIKTNSDRTENVAENLIMCEIGNKAEDYYRYEKNINSVTLEEVKNLAEKMKENYSTAIISPKG